MRRFFLIAVLLVAPASIASACMNDRESNQSEKEFKSNYLEQPVAPASPPPVSHDLVVMGEVGSGLLLGAFALGFFFTRRKDSNG
jgi:hypothetical protein